MTTTRFRSATAALLALATLAAAVAEDVAAPAASRGPGDSRAGLLDVAGGRLAGELVPVPEIAGGARETFLWKSPRFATPFEFRIGEVSGITFPPQPDRPRPAGPFVHLRGGDVIAATVESLDADALVASVAGPDGPQRLRIAREELVGITRAGDGSGSYAGPSGLLGWDQAPPGSWREEAGRIMTDKAGAAVSRDVSAPARARFDIRLSRRRAAEFRLAVAAAERSADDRYVLQAVGGDAAGGMMLVRRSGGRAVIEPLPAVPWRGDAIRVILFIDQVTGRLAAILPDAQDADARRATEATLPPAAADRPSGRFRLELTSGDVCLERLQVSAWRGAEPTLRDAAETTIVTRAGGLEGFSVTSFDAARGEYVLARGAETRRVAAAEIEEIRFPDTGAADGEAAVRVVRADGGTLAGDLAKVDERVVWLRRRGVDAAVAIPRDEIAAIRSQRPAPRREEPAGRVGTLVAGDDRLRGWLVGGADGGLAWRPLGSANAAGFAEQPAVEVEYVARRAEKKGGEVQVGGIGGLVNRDAEGFFIVAMMAEGGAAARDGRIQPGDRILEIAPTETARFVETKERDNETVTRLLRGRIGTVVRLKVVDAAGANPRDIDLARGPISVTGDEILKQAEQTHRDLAGAVEPAAGARGQYPSLVVLRSGDEVPCRVEAIDADGVLLKSPLTGGADAAAVRVPASLVKALELEVLPASSLDSAPQEWLLTLPRMQRDRPPTHLLRLVGGDYVRGRLVRVDEKAVTFEILDVVKQWPRGVVSRIIWLHPDVPGPDGDVAAGAGPKPEPKEGQLLVQGIDANGRRTTLVAEGVEGNMLDGSSRALGPGRIDLGQVDRLLIGGAIGRDGGKLPFSRWTLKPAREPRALGKPEEK